MMDDHEILSLARNELADALKALLKPEIMTIADFRESLNHTIAAMNATIDLIHRPSQ